MPEPSASVRIDPVTGDRIVRVADVKPRAARENELQVTLWDLLNNSTIIENVEGDKVLTLRPITLETMAKLESLEEEQSKAGGGKGTSYSIKFITAIVNDAKARRDGTAMTEEEVGRRVTSDLWPIILQLVNRLMSPLPDAGASVTTTPAKA